MIFKSRFIEVINSSNCAEYTLNDLCSKWLKGQGLKKDEMCVDGSSKCIHYGELFTRYGPIIYDVISKTNNAPNKVSLVGDILFPASDVTPNGLSRCSMIDEDGVILGGDIIILRPIAGINPAFLSYAINQEKGQLINRVTGAIVKHISSHALKTVTVKLPAKTQQDDYINFIHQVDKSKLMLEKSEAFITNHLHQTTNGGDMCA